jgi:hypothetical protein
VNADGDSMRGTPQFFSQKPSVALWNDEGLGSFVAANLAAELGEVASQCSMDMSKDCVDRESLRLAVCCHGDIAQLVDLVVEEEDPVLGLKARMSVLQPGSAVNMTAMTD